MDITCFSLAPFIYIQREIEREIYRERELEREREKERERMRERERVYLYYLYTFVIILNWLYILRIFSPNAETSFNEARFSWCNDELYICILEEAQEYHARMNKISASENNEVNGSLQDPLA